MASMLNFLSNIISQLGNSGQDSHCYCVLSGSTGSVSFPVAPSSFEVGNTYSNQTVNINALGDMNMLGKRGLATISFSSFFPAQYYGFEQGYNQEDPYTLVDQVKSMATSGQPCRLSISGTNINMPCTVDSFTHKEKDGSGDVYFDISLKEYRYFLPSAEETVNESTGLKSRVADTVKERTITVYPGDHPMDVAARSVSQFTSISKQQANKLQLYKSIVMSGKVSEGDILHAAKTQIRVGDNTTIKF